MDVTLTLLQDNGLLIETFFSDCRLRGMTDETIRGYQSNLRIYAEYVANTDANLIDIDNQALKRLP